MWFFEGKKLNVSHLVKYFEVNDGMCLSGLDKEACGKIAAATGSKLMEIVNKDTWFFPQGCYITVSHNIFFYNVYASTKRCDKDRMCICNLGNLHKLFTK